MSTNNNNNMHPNREGDLVDLATVLQRRNRTAKDYVLQTCGPNATEDMIKTFLKDLEFEYIISDEFRKQCLACAVKPVVEKKQPSVIVTAENEETVVVSSTTKKKKKTSV